MANDDDDRLARRTKALFDDSVERLDAATLSELNRARHRALEELERGHRARSRGWLLPLGGVTAAAVLALLVVGTNDGDPAAPAPIPAAERDFEMLIDDSSLEMLEDLEFYAWLELAEMDDAGHTG